MTRQPVSHSISGAKSPFPISEPSSVFFGLGALSKAGNAPATPLILFW